MAKNAWLRVPVVLADTIDSIQLVTDGADTEKFTLTVVLTDGTRASQDFTSIGVDTGASLTVTEVI